MSPLYCNPHKKAKQTFDSKNYEEWSYTNNDKVCLQSLRLVWPRTELVNYNQFKSQRWQCRHNSISLVFNKSSFCLVRPCQFPLANLQSIMMVVSSHLFWCLLSSCWISVYPMHNVMMSVFMIKCKNVGKNNFHTLAWLACQLCSRWHRDWFLVYLWTWTVNLR